MEAALLCERMGWTKQEYDSQPALFVDTVAAMLRADKEASDKKISQQLGGVK